MEVVSNILFFSVRVSMTYEDVIRSVPVAVCFTSVGAELCIIGGSHCLYTRTPVPGYWLYNDTRVPLFIVLFL